MFLSWLPFVSQCANMSNSGAECKKLIIVSNVQGKCAAAYLILEAFYFCLCRNSGEGKRIMLFVFFLFFSLFGVEDHESHLNSNKAFK